MSAARPAASSPAACSASPARPPRSPPPSTASRWRATASRARAIWLGVWASVWGGLLGALCLVFLTGPLAAIALEFGPWEYFSLFVLAMAMVAGLTEASLVKGLLSTAIGLLITVDRHRPDRQRAALHLRLGVHRRRLPVPARADRHLRLRPDHDRHREDATTRRPRLTADLRSASSRSSRTSRSTGRSSASPSCCCGRPSSA